MRGGPVSSTEFQPSCKVPDDSNRLDALRRFPAGEKDAFTLRGSANAAQPPLSHRTRVQHDSGPVADPRPLPCDAVFCECR